MHGGENRPRQSATSGHRRVAVSRQQPANRRPPKSGVPLRSQSTGKQAGVALAVGTLGSYEVLAPLGAGGRGEVYRARDPRLGRNVAIKVLPAEVASDPERLTRFRREAQLLTSLNHPLRCGGSWPR